MTESTYGPETPNEFLGLKSDPIMPLGIADAGTVASAFSKTSNIWSKFRSCTVCSGSDDLGKETSKI